MLKRLTSFFITAALLSLSPPALSEPQKLILSDFTYGAELTTAESEFRRFTLTPTMMNDMLRRDLGDIRVFDVNNDLMPSVVRKKNKDIKTSKQKLNISRFKKAGEVKGYILDRTRNHKQSLESLHLEWKRGYAPSVLSMTVEHSSDKKSWKTLKDITVVSNIKYGKGILKQNIIPLNKPSNRFIRLKFLDALKTPILSSVTAYSTSKVLPEDAWVSGGKLKPEKGASNTYRFNVSKGVSPKFIKFSFGKLNSMLSGSLYALSSVDGKSQRKLAIKNFNSYVFSRNNKVVKSNPIDVSKFTASEWLVTATAKINFTDEELPGVTVAYPHYEVIFADDGDAPYTAVWGNKAAAKASAKELIDRIKANNLTWGDVAVVNSGGILNNAELTAIMESRETSWLMIIIGLFALALISAAGMLAYKRYKSM